MELTLKKAPFNSHVPVRHASVTMQDNECKAAKLNWANIKHLLCLPWKSSLSIIMLSTIIYLLSANEHCCILDSGITWKPVNVQSRSKPAFSEPLPSTHHCSRGWARGSSLSICFLISRYEPWQKKKKKTQPCVVCSSFLVSTDFLFFFNIVKWARDSWFL